MIWL